MTPAEQLRALDVPRDVRQVEGCTCGGLEWHFGDCALWQLPNREACRRITVAEARIRRYTVELNARL